MDKKKLGSGLKTFLKESVTSTFKDYKHKEDDVCSICIEKYEADDVILVYYCDRKHYFHLVCGSEWLKMRHDCPLCRIDFKQAIMAVSEIQ